MPVPPTGAPLRADALADRTLLWAAPASDRAQMPHWTQRLTGYGAHLVPLTDETSASAAADLLLADLRLAAADAEPAAVVTAGFLAARQALPALTTGQGAVLFLLPPPDAGKDSADGAALVTATVSLARSLAQEWADRQIRVNAVIAAGTGDRLADLIGYLASPAAVMLTGQLLDLTETTTVD